MYCRKKPLLRCCCPIGVVVHSIYIYTCLSCSCFILLLQEFQDTRIDLIFEYWKNGQLTLNLGCILKRQQIDVYKSYVLKTCCFVPQQSWIQQRKDHWHFFVSVCKPWIARLLVQETGGLMDVGAFLERNQEELDRLWKIVKQHDERISWAVFVSVRIDLPTAKEQPKSDIFTLVQSISEIKIGQTGTLRHTATHCDTLRHTATHCDTLHISQNSSLRTAADFTAKRLAQRRRAKDCCTLNPGASPVMEYMEALGSNKFYHWHRPKNEPNATCWLIHVRPIFYICFGKHTLCSGKSMKFW